MSAETTPAETSEPTSGLRKIFPDAGWTASYWEVSQLTSLPLAALGLHTYLMSLPDGWNISAVRIAQTRCEGRDAIRNAMRQLQASGLCETVKERTKDGKVRTRTHIFAVPQERLAKPTNPQVTPETDNQAPVENQETPEDPKHETPGHTGAWKPGLRSTRPLRRETPQEIHKDLETQNQNPPPPERSDTTTRGETAVENPAATEPTSAPAVAGSTPFREEEATPSTPKTKPTTGTLTDTEARLLELVPPSRPAPSPSHLAVLAKRIDDITGNSRYYGLSAELLFNYLASGISNADSVTAVWYSRLKDGALPTNRATQPPVRASAGSRRTWCGRCSSPGDRRVIDDLSGFLGATCPTCG